MNPGSEAKYLLISTMRTNSFPTTKCHVFLRLAFTQYGMLLPIFACQTTSAYKILVKINKSSLFPLPAPQPQVRARDGKSYVDRRFAANRLNNRKQCSDHPPFVVLFAALPALDSGSYPGCRCATTSSPMQSAIMLPNLSFTDAHAKRTPLAIFFAQH